MHIFFIGIGGTAIGPLALIAHQAGYSVSGSDKQDSQYIQYLKKHGITDIHIADDQNTVDLINQTKPIDWIVHSSAVSIENPNHPQIHWAHENSIKITKRDELLNQIIKDHNLKLIAIAGTHGKTTTTAMAIWLFKQLGIPISYSVGAKIPFGEMGIFDPKSQYFIYECDEFDRNFLHFTPYLSLITGVDYDHHEIYHSIEDYRNAFQQFIDQSEQNVLWEKDVSESAMQPKDGDTVISEDERLLNALSIIGEVNRRNATQVIVGTKDITGVDFPEAQKILEAFPGLSRRFEMIKPGLYSDYAHTIPKIAGCLQLAHEVSRNVVIIYEPLTNRRQYFIKQHYHTLFKGVKRLYWVPSYLAREDPDQPILSPAELIEELENKDIATPAKLDDQLKKSIQDHIQQGDLVVAISGGGGNSLDEWLREEFLN